MRYEYKEINRKIGAKIRRMRESTGMVRDEFSEKVGISTQFLTDIERGRTGPSLTTLCKICDILGVSTDSILRDYDSDLEDFAKEVCALLAGVDRGLYGSLLSSLREQVNLIHTAQMLAKTKADETGPNGQLKI